MIRRRYWLWAVQPAALLALSLFVVSAQAQTEIKGQRVFSAGHSFHYFMPPILGDKIQLEQVLLNLLQNAIEAVTAAESAPRVVQVVTHCDDASQITISVRDTGVGLAPGEAERVFERFHSTKTYGMGLGLAISRTIAEAHGGRLWGHANPDRGATFTLTLPILRSSSL